MDKAVADLRGGREGRAPPPSGPKFLHFHAVFGKNWPNNRLAPPPLGLVPPPLGNPGSCTAKPEGTDGFQSNFYWNSVSIVSGDDKLPNARFWAWGKLFNTDSDLASKIFVIEVLRTTSQHICLVVAR